LRVLHADALERFCRAQAALGQALGLLLLAGVHHPDGVHLAGELTFEQLDRLDDDHFVPRPADQHVDGLPDDRVGEGFEPGQRFRMAEGDRAQFRAVDALVFVQNPLPKGEDNRFVCRGAGSHDLVGQAIRVDRVGAQMLQHPAHQALAGRDVAREADYGFAFPATHGSPS